jgi:hypothetical protein
MVTFLKKYHCVTEKEQIKTDSFTNILDSLICYSRDALFSTWQILKRQPERLNPETDNDVNATLDAWAQFVFDMWLQFTGGLILARFDYWKGAFQDQHSNESLYRVNLHREQWG